MNNFNAAVIVLLTCTVAFTFIVLLYWKKIFSTMCVIFNCLFGARTWNNNVRITNGNCEQDPELPESNMAVVVPESACGSCGAVADLKCPSLSPSYRRFLAMRAEIVEDVVSPAACASKVFNTLPITRERGEVAPFPGARRKLYTFPSTRKGAEDSLAAGSRRKFQTPPRFRNESRRAIRCSVSLPEETCLNEKKEAQEGSPSASPLSITVDIHKTVHIPFMGTRKEDVITHLPPKIGGIKKSDAHSESVSENTGPIKIIQSSSPSVPEKNKSAAPENTGAIPKTRTSRFPLKENNQAVGLSVSVPRIRTPPFPTEEFDDAGQPVSFLINAGAIRVKQTAACPDVHNSADRDVGLVLKARDVSIDVPLEASLELEKARKRFLVKMNTTDSYREESRVKIRNGFFAGLIYKKTMAPRPIVPCKSRLELDSVFHTSHYKSYKKVVKNRSAFRKENSAPPIALKDLSPEKIEALRKKRLRNQTIRFESINELVKQDERLQACGSPETSTGPENRYSHINPAGSYY